MQRKWKKYRVTYWKGSDFYIAKEYHGFNPVGYTSENDAAKTWYVLAKRQRYAVAAAKRLAGVAEKADA